MNKWKPLEYYNKGRTVLWGKDLTDEDMESLRSGEIFILLDEIGASYCEILVDSYGQIREHRI
jgi:hypothetical protein